MKKVKTAIWRQSELDSFLSGALCKEVFDHCSIVRFSGVCFQGSDEERVPELPIILPFKKHGDLHNFCIPARGPACVPTQMVVNFMAVASGTEYLSTKRVIHWSLLHTEGEHVHVWSSSGSPRRSTASTMPRHQSTGLPWRVYRNLLTYF